MEKNWYPAYSIRSRTPDGTMFVHISEDEKGKLYKLHLNLGKAGTSVAAWAFALESTLNLAIMQGTKLEDLIALLSSITSGNAPRVAIGGKCTSGPEGLWMALMRYRRTKNEELRKGLNLVPEDRQLQER